MKKYIYCLLLIGLNFGALHCGGSDTTMKVKVVSATTGQELGAFQAEIADEPREQATGLMFRKELGKNQGMLFIFAEDRLGAFWMQNTLISLDIIFIDSNKKIVNIVARAEPQTLTPRRPTGPYRYVLELNGGRSEQLGISSGDQVEF